MRRLQKHKIAGRNIQPELLLERIERLVGKMAKALRALLANSDHKRYAQLHGMVEDLPVKLLRLRAKLEHVAKHGYMLAVARGRGKRIKESHHFASLPEKNSRTTLPPEIKSIL